MSTGSGLSALDDIREGLLARYPGWQVWWVPRQGRGVTWCARPHPLVNADDPEDLAAAIERADSERGLRG